MSSREERQAHLREMVRKAEQKLDSAPMMDPYTSMQKEFSEALPKPKANKSKRTLKAVVPPNPNKPSHAALQAIARRDEPLTETEFLLRLRLPDDDPECIKHEMECFGKLFPWADITEPARARLRNAHWAIGVYKISDFCSINPIWLVGTLKLDDPFIFRVLDHCIKAQADDFGRFKMLTVERLRMDPVSLDVDDRETFFNLVPPSNHRPCKQHKNGKPCFMDHYLDEAQKATGVRELNRWLTIELANAIWALGVFKAGLHKVSQVYLRGSLDMKDDRLKLAMDHIGEKQDFPALTLERKHIAHLPFYQELAMRVDDATKAGVEPEISGGFSVGVGMGTSGNARANLEEAQASYERALAAAKRLQKYKKVSQKEKKMEAAAASIQGL